MATVKQLLELAFKDRQYDINIITFDKDDVCPNTFEPMKNKLKFKVGDYEFRVMGTNADDEYYEDKNFDAVAEIAAALLQELEYDMVYEFLRQNKKV